MKTGKNIRNHIYSLIDKERERQIKKWGNNRKMNPFAWVVVISEEIGEVSRVLLQGKDQPDLEEEIIQIAAVAIAWLEDLSKHPIDLYDDLEGIIYG